MTLSQLKYSLTAEALWLQTSSKRLGGKHEVLPFQLTSAETLLSGLFSLICSLLIFLDFINSSW